MEQLAGSNSNRIVRVSAAGAASITVSADGKSSKFDFRIKRIPDPVFKVGDGKIRMPSVAFKAQDFCRAELEAFDFDTKYSMWYKCNSLFLWRKFCKRTNSNDKRKHTGSN